ncbi:carbohydrate ABC transporter permease [Bacillus marinisedimentorum]|uniref:carbohydrate ABC transporter permease n=1 Tax=Bacillus marinisedimentorum TaxID=1821260 RepID=UPI0007DEAF2E|nr:carbohydrate ABC transporter permease [Bacillus marinisedimentorum]
MYRRILPKTIMYVLLVLFAVTMLLPFVWMVSSSLKPLSEIFSHPPTLIPETFRWENFSELFEKFPFIQNIFNSLYIAVVYTVLAAFFCALGGFAFAKYEFKYKNILFIILFGSMMIPQEVLMIPLYVVFKNLNWIDTHWGLIIPGIANAFGIFFMRQFIQSVPNDLLDAARIDGLGEFGIFTKIILPVIKPGLASLGIIFFMNSWNNFLWPLILLKSPEMYTVTVAIYSITGGLRQPYHWILAGSVISVIPLFVIFLIFERQFIAGITQGAVKG